MTMLERPNELPATANTPAHSSFADFHFVMIEPSHPGNIGAAARALKTMGFSQLVLVHTNPSIITHPDAIAMASGALDVLQGARVVDSLAQALAPIHLSFALSARSRYLGPRPCTIRSAAQQAVALQQQQQQNQIAFVLGTERVGLTNEQTAQCNFLCHIPANPAYSSLNVAQALQLTAWELRYALLTEPEHDTNCSQAESALLPQVHRGKKHQRAQPASGAQVEALLAHWLTALHALDFISPSDQKRIPERMAHFFRHAQMREDEVSLFRGVCSAILKKTKTSD